MIPLNRLHRSLTFLAVIAGFAVTIPAATSSANSFTLLRGYKDKYWFGPVLPRDTAHVEIPVKYDTPPDYDPAELRLDLKPRRPQDKDLVRHAFHMEPEYCTVAPGKTCDVRVRFRSERPVVDLIAEIDIFIDGRREARIVLAGTALDSCAGPVYEPPGLCHEYDLAE